MKHLRFFELIFQVKGGRDRNRRKMQERDDDSDDMDEDDAEDSRLAMGQSPATPADDDDTPRTSKQQKVFVKERTKGYKWSKHSQPAEIMKGVKPTTITPTERDKRHLEKTGEKVMERRLVLDNYKVCFNFFF